MGIIRGVGPPGKKRPAGTLYEDSQSGILYVQNQSPHGNNWSPLDSNSTDDSTGGSGSFSGGTVTNATNFLSTISSGGTNIGLLFASTSHSHSISHVSNLQDTLNAKASSENPSLTGVISLLGRLKLKTTIARLTPYTVDVGAADECVIISESISKEIFLPSDPESGRFLMIINEIDMDGNTTTLDPNGKLINGNSSYPITNALSSVILVYVSDKSGWYVISKIDN